ncbi:MAG: hypothetical protein EU535_00180 [Promethearchaeota archaeon]|nr:MAG: hypothetical protein EU535_00180 [Candidatus Lokiarchaeota archaeon]
MVTDELIESQSCKGKVAVISGGFKGMGKTTAKDFVQLGESVCLIAKEIDILKFNEDEYNKLKTDDSQFVKILHLFKFNIFSIMF